MPLPMGQIDFAAATFGATCEQSCRARHEFIAAVATAKPVHAMSGRLTGGDDDNGAESLVQELFADIFGSHPKVLF